MDHIARTLETGETQQLEYALVIGGSEVCFAGMLTPLSPNSVLVVARDITPQVHQREQALSSERARAEMAEHLNEEINHRARNNLAMVSGLLQTQALQERDPQVAARLLEAVARIRTFVDIHEKIYATGIEEVDLLEILQQVAETLRGIFAGVGAEFSVAGESGLIPTRAATNLAVVTNELMTNAVKYGGPAEDGSLHIDVRVTRAEGMLGLSVWNSGNPIPEGFEVAAQERMGLRLIVGLVAQYGGQFELRPLDNGTLAYLRVEEAKLNQ